MTPIAHVTYLFDRVIIPPSPLLDLKGSMVHKLVRNVGLMAGDVEGGGGRKNHSSFNERWFADENFVIPHSEKVKNN